MKNFIKNNFYSFGEIFGKIGNEETLLDNFRILISIALIISYGVLIFIGFFAFILWEFLSYEIYFRTLFILIILNILIFKK